MNLLRYVSSRQMSARQVQAGCVGAVVLLFSLLQLKEQAGPNLHLLIFGTTFDEKLCYQLQLLYQYQYKPIIVGYLGELATSWPNANKDKIPAIYHYLMHNTSDAGCNDVISFLDGGDVWPQVSPGQYIRAFQKSPKTLIWSAQKFCWPNVGSAMARPCAEVPDTPLNKSFFGQNYGSWDKVMPRYANGGSMVGCASQARAAYRRFTRELANPRMDDLGVDQMLVQYLYWEGGYELELDLEVDFFLAMDHVMEDEIEKVESLDRPRAIYKSLWNNKVQPFIHWNGREWKDRALGWMESDPARLRGWTGVDQMVLLTNGTELPYRKVCPGFPKGV